MSKPTKHIRRKKLHQLPVWIRSDEFRLLNNNEKNFLGYLYCFGPDTCWQWDCRFAKKFHRHRSTIQRWLRKLREQGFIWIQNPHTKHRLIHARLIPTPEHWVQLIGTLALSSGLRKHRRPRGARRGFPPPLHEYSSPASIEQARHDIINELVHRGESFETASKVADIVIEKSRQKKGLGMSQK
jgi:hypothetical protein